MIIKRTHQTPFKYQYGGSSQSIRTRYRYGGNGIFNNLMGRKLMGDTVKNLINTAGKSKVAQRTATAVLNGVGKAIESQTQEGVEQLAKATINKIKGKKKSERKYQDAVNSTIQSLIENIPTTSSIEDIINSGKGIIYD